MASATSVAQTDNMANILGADATPANATANSAIVATASKSTSAPVARKPYAKVDRSVKAVRYRA